MIETIPSRADDPERPMPDPADLPRQRPPAAEQLLNWLAALKAQPGITHLEGPPEELDRLIARIALAKKLAAHPLLAFRAQVERWDPQRITRELY